MKAGSWAYLSVICKVSCRVSYKVSYEIHCKVAFKALYPKGWYEVHTNIFNRELHGKSRHFSLFVKGVTTIERKLKFVPLG